MIITGNVLAEGAARSLGKLLTNTMEIKVLVTTHIKNCLIVVLLPSLIMPVAFWGLQQMTKINRVQTIAMRCYFGVINMPL